MEEKPERKDTSIAIIVIIAGLLTGGVLAYVFLQPDEAPPRYTPEYRVADSQRIPLDSVEEQPEAADEEQPEAAGEDADASDPADQAGAAPEEAASSASPATPEDSPSTDRAADRTESTASDRKAIEEARDRMEARGVDEYAEMTEELYIRVSAKMVLMASVLSESSEEDADPAEVQSLLADNAAEVLASERVDPEDFWSYTRDVHSDPERAKEMGEKILREAEKHTQRKITFEDVPGMEPTPVKGAEQE